MTAPSPFAISGARLRERDLAVMPCGPGTKFPGAYASATGWRTAWDWQEYCNVLPSRFAMEIWERWPDAGICLALGRSSAPDGMQLVAIDIDTEEPAEVAAILAVLPGSPVRKRGAKGETQFYLAPKSVPNRPYNDAQKRRMLDLLCHGRQTVLPPTIHPDCPHCGTKGAVVGADMACRDCGGIGQAYRWTTLDTLENFDVADLPILPADIADRLSEALAPFGHVDAPKLERGSADPDAEISTHRQLNDAALGNLAAWVPDLSLYKCREYAGKYKAVSHWRPSSSGRPLSARATNLAISSDGIKDCGEGKGYTPIDLVMAATGGSLDEAFRFLQERVAPAAPVLLAAREAPAVEPQNVGQFRGNLAGLRLADFDGSPIPCLEILERHQAAATTIIAPDLCTPPGLIGDIVSWMVSCSPEPSPQLCLSVTLSFLGTVYGRRFAMPSGLRTNLYCIGLAGTGFGKSFPLKCVNAIDRAAGLERFFGPSGIKSDSALRKLLEKKNPVFVSVDEIGELFAKILHRNAPAHENGIKQLLLDFFSSADDVYRGSEGASEAAVSIQNPHLNVTGMSTPTAFWRAFNSVNSENGLLPRILIFDAGENLPPEVESHADRNRVPTEIVKALHRALDVRPAGNLENVIGGRVQPLTAAFGAGAEHRLRELKSTMKRRGRAAGGLEETAYSRFAEHTAKLALIHAVSINPESPVVTCETLDWAEAIVHCTTRALLAGTVDRVADNEHEAEYKAVLRLVKEGGSWGVSTRSLKKAIGGKIEKRRLDAHIDTAKEAGEIESYLGTGPKGGAPSPRLRTLNAGEDE